jgi:hypothetical protein
MLDLFKLLLAIPLTIQFLLESLFLLPLFMLLFEFGEITQELVLEPVVLHEDSNNWD